MTSNNNNINLSAQLQQLAMQQMQNMSPILKEYKNGLNNDSPNNGEPSDLDNTNLYIKGLWKDCTQIELDDLFKQFGVIAQSRVYGDGVGFVRFEQGFEAKAAIDSMDKRKLSRSEDVLVVKYAFKKQRKNTRYVREAEMIMNKNKNNIYLRGLPQGFTETQLTELCEQYGELTCTRLRESGVAFVRYRKPEDAQKAIRTLNGKQFDGTNGSLLAKLANSDPFQPKIGFKQSFEESQENDNISTVDSTNTMTPSQTTNDNKLTQLPGPPQPPMLPQQQQQQQQHAYIQYNQPYMPQGPPPQVQQHYTYAPQHYDRRYYTPRNIIISTPGPQPQPYPHNYTHPNNGYNNIYYTQYQSYPVPGPVQPQPQYVYPPQPQPQPQPPPVQVQQQPQYIQTVTTPPTSTPPQKLLVTAPKYVPNKVNKPKTLYIPPVYYQSIGSPASELSFRGVNVNTHGSEKSSIAHVVDGLITEMVAPITPITPNKNVNNMGWKSANANINENVSIDKAMQNLKIIEEPNNNGKENMISDSSNPHGVTRVVANQLHEVISKWYPTQAGKLTGMFLQNHDQEKVSKYLGRQDKLKKKIDTFAKLLSHQLTK